MLLNSILPAGSQSTEPNLLTSPGRRRAVLKSALLEPRKSRLLEPRKSRLSSTRFPLVSSWRSEAGTGAGTGWLSRFKDLTLKFQLPSIYVAKLAVCAAISTKKSLENSWLLNVAPFPLVNSWLPASGYIFYNAIQSFTLLFTYKIAIYCDTVEVRWKMRCQERMVPSFAKRDGNLRVDRPTISHSATCLDFVSQTLENVQLWPFTTNIISV